MEVEHIHITRGDMVDHLVKSDIAYNESNPDYMESIFLFGFHGYMNASNESLINDYKFYLSQDPTKKFNITIKEGL